MYAATGTWRFHSGWMGEALCGVWQKMHTCCSPVARIVPGPVAERLCGLLTTLLPVGVPAALCASEIIGAQQFPRMRTSGRRLRVRAFIAVASPPECIGTTGFGGCTHPRR